MKKIICIILSVLLIGAVFGACKKAEEPETTSATVTTDTTVETTTERITETTSESTTKKEKSFDNWSEKDLVNYFKAEKLFTEEDYLGVFNNIEEVPEGVSAEIEYNSHDNDKINVLIFYFDEDTENKAVDEAYEKVKKNRYYEFRDGEVQQPFNALVGRFAIFYSGSVDEKYVKKFEAALDKLIKDKKIKPDFYEKNLDLSKFKKDDVIIIEADD